MHYPKLEYQTRIDVMESLGFTSIEKTSQGTIVCKYKPEKGLRKEFTAYTAIEHGNECQLMVIGIMENIKNLEAILKMYSLVMKAQDFVILVKKNKLT